MDITVSMTAEEFQEFIEYRANRATFAAKMKEQRAKTEIMAKKVCWALEQNPKNPEKVKITDQDHAAELLELAKDYLS